MKNLIVDAGPLIALFDKSDQYHERILQYIASFEGTLVTTWPIVTEVLHMLSFNVQVQLDFLTWIDMKGLSVIDIDSSHLKRLIDLTKKYGDVPMDFADATLIVLSEKMHLNEILTIDSDFYVYRNIRNHYLHNVLAK